MGKLTVRAKDGGEAEGSRAVRELSLHSCRIGEIVIAQMLI